MKKVLIAVCFLGVAVTVNAGTTPLLVEAYQEGQISIPKDAFDTLTVVELSFSVDSNSYVQFSAGGLAALGELWLELNGEILPPIAKILGTMHTEGFTISYTYLINPGDYSIIVGITGVWGDRQYPTLCEKTYLQALIFLPDAGGAIAERPAGDVEPTEGMTSVISRGPYVNVTGATELVDGTGRVIENAITDDKVSISNLPQGTYFARDGERTVVKIVKVD
jgi:hypothetical protein